MRACGNLFIKPKCKDRLNQIERSSHVPFYSNKEKGLPEKMAYFLGLPSNGE